MYIYFDEKKNSFEATVSKADTVSFSWIEVGDELADEVIAKLEELKDQCIPYWVVSVTDSYIAPAVESFHYLNENTAENTYDDFEADCIDGDGSDVEIKEYNDVPFSRVFHNFDEREILSI